MAIFKDGAQQTSAWNINGHPKMQALLHILDGFHELLWGYQVVVTSAIRPPTEKPSYHPKGQAIDLRIKDRPDWCIRLTKYVVDFVGYLMKKFDKQHEIKGEFQFVREDDHVHIELDDGEPICT